MSHTSLALSRPWLSVTHWGRRMRRLRNTALLALQVHGERRTLRGLDDRALTDLGFSRSEADGESHRGFWDLPPKRTWI